ncbi:hypothetical protein [Persephonella sp.]
MRYLEQIFNIYLENKKNPIPDLNIDLTSVEKKEIPILPRKEKDKKPHFEFGEVYFFVNKKGVPIFFMINGKVEESKNELYSVYKVSDFTEFATQKDFIFEMNNLSYIVETWNEFYLYKDSIENALFIGKLSNEDLYILQDVLDGIIEIPQEKRGLTIPEDGNYIQHKFQEEEVKDIETYKSLIFEIFEDIEVEEEINFLEEMLSKSLEEVEVPELVFASEEETYAEKEDFILLKEQNIIRIKITNKQLIGKKVLMEIFGKKIKTILPEEFKFALPEKLKDISIEYLANNIRLEEI